MHIQDIDRCLSQLEQELRNMGIQQPVRILVIGGVFMVTQVGNRLVTEDIDVLFKDIHNRKTSPVYQATMQAVKMIAVKNNIEGDWLNDGFSHLLRSMGGVPEGTLWRKYGVLELYIPPVGYILALKLLAYRPKDKGDIEALFHILNIQTPQQALSIVHQYIPNRAVDYIFGIEETLDEIF